MLDQYQLGKGATSCVYRVRSKASGRHFAMKVLDKQQIARQRTKAATSNEIRIHSQLKCPQIAELHHTFEDESSIYLVLELCEGTELFQEIQTHIAVKKNYTGKGQVVQGAMEEDIAARYFRQIALGVKYM